MLNGIIFVGDPHAQSRNPGRRIDDYTSAIPKKLAFVRDLAEKNGYGVIVLGDMFSRAQDSQSLLMTRLCHAMRGRMPWYCLVGNHDIHELVLTDDTALAILGAAGVISILCKPGILTLETVHGPVNIHHIPYGHEIPLALPIMAGPNILISHADIVAHKESGYPGAVVNPQIENCPLAINGHVHKQQVGMKGGTQWILPGSLGRGTLDVSGQTPHVLVFQNGEIEFVEVPHEKNVFDFTGKIAPVKKPDLESGELNSLFAELLKKESSLDMKRSNGGDVLKEELNILFAAQKTDPDVQKIVLGLIEKVVECV